MKAKFVNETLQDIFKPKTADENPSLFDVHDVRRIH